MVKKTMKWGGPSKVLYWGQPKRRKFDSLTKPKRKPKNNLRGGDLTPRPKNFRPADLGLTPLKKRKY